MNIEHGPHFLRKRVQKVSEAVALPEMRDRANSFVRALYPANTNKELQRRHGLSEPQAERLLMGQGSLPMIIKLGQDFGWRFVYAVMQPLWGPPPSIGELLVALDETKRVADEQRRQSEELHAGLVRAMDGLVLSGPDQAASSACDRTAGQGDLLGQPREEIGDGHMDGRP
jgi:hypothetical protein